MTDTTSQNMSMNNEGYVLNNSFMMMRIDTSSLIEDIRNFLSSQERALTKDEDGEWTETVRKVGLPLANEEGIMRICNIVRMRVNHHVSQGNINKEHYWDFISRARKEITETIVKKCYDWQIEDSNLNMVVDEISALIEMFITRTIENKERDSYSQQIQAKEIITQQQPKTNIFSAPRNLQQ